MKILIVCSATNQRIAPFIQEQADSLQHQGESVDFFLIRKKGIRGYLSALPKLKKHIRLFQPDIVHAHYGLSGLLANLQNQVPVITTFHGSDINVPSVRKWSRWAIRLSCHSIFVSQQAIDLIGLKKKFTLLPCGIDTKLFHPINKLQARHLLGWDPTERYILFSGSKDNAVKNYPLAHKATQNLQNVTLIELKDYSREEVNLLMNAADLALMTSICEGSPQFIKEAMACNCPVVSTNVGDVKNLTLGIDGCYITTFESTVVTQSVKEALQFANDIGRTHGRKRIEECGLTLENVATELRKIYRICIHERK